MNKRRKTRGEILKDSESSDDHAPSTPMGYLHDKPELPSDSSAQVYELPAENAAEVAEKVLITPEVHSTPLVELPLTPLVELPGDTKR